jgi:hypothetical protein
VSRPVESAALAAEPLERGGYPAWADAGRRAQVLFTGKGPAAPREEVLAAVTAGRPQPPDGLAAARQIHSAVVLAADRAGSCGEGDALVTRSPGLALSVVTADCVPLLVEAGEWIGAVHAGWRGIVAGVVGATAERLRAAGAPEAAGWTAWVGPAIGACCYEVGPEVAARVAVATTPAVVVATAGRPRLDLAGAVGYQLAAAGVGDVRRVARCTRCHPEELWSYRREGARAGRNHAFIWRP